MEKDIKVGTVLKYTGGRFYQIIEELGSDGVKLYHFASKDIHNYSHSILEIQRLKDWSLATPEEIIKASGKVIKGIIYNYQIL